MRIPVLPLLAVAGCAQLASAQIGSAPARSIEVIAGANFATITNVQGMAASTGFVGGVGVIDRLTSRWALQPELIYSMKGTKESNATTKVTVTIPYVEIAALLRYDLLDRGVVRPLLLAGPTVAAMLSCRGKVTTSAGTSTRSCANAGLDVRRPEQGVMLGGGLAFHAMNRAMTVGARYNFGLSNVTIATPSKNRVLALVGGVEWPW